MVSSRHSTTMENLPGEVISNIFIRLLAKQLAQMRCVCKSWNALLSESYFVKSHLHHSIHNKEEILLFFPRGFCSDCNPLTVCPSRSSDLQPTNFIKIPYHIQSINKSYIGRLIGSVNGLICFYYVSCSFGFRDHVVYIWNPSLSMLLTLPPCSLPASDGKRFHFRFGYDPKTDDYKVVKLARLPECKIEPQAEVYSMRKGSWDIISQRCPSHYTLVKIDDEACVDDHVHWLCYTDVTFKSKVIVAFDLGAETFRELSLPDFMQHRLRYRFNELGTISGKLCVMSCVKGGECEVWVMNEYGVAESWVKNHPFSPLSGEITAYGFTLHNEFLCEAHKDRCFAFYDPVADEIKTMKITGVLGLYKIVEYVDSLVWVAPAEHQMSCYNISQY